MGKARETREALPDRRQVEAERKAGGDRGAGVLRVVRAAQAADAGEIGDGFRFATGRAQDARALRVIAVAQSALHGDPLHALAGARDAVGGSARPVIVDADHRGAARLHAGRQTLLDGGVVLHRAVAVEMVFRDVEQNADGRMQRGREIDLIGRHFEHVDAAGCEGCERQHRHADIAAHLGVAAGAVDEMRDQRRRGRFAVGAGDGDERSMSRPILRARGRTVRCRR